jgi:hypothetical protein
MPDDLAATVQALQDILREPERATQIAEVALADIVKRKMGLVACPEGRVPVRIPPLEPGAAGWAKWVFSVDPKAAGGFMFDGPFLPVGGVSPLPPGAVVLIADGSGATKRRGSKPYVGFATAWIVQPDGSLAGNPMRAHRSEWQDLAERIGAYLKTSRELPLLGGKVFPTPPVPYDHPPIPHDILMAAILAAGPQGQARPDRAPFLPPSIRAP